MNKKTNTTDSGITRRDFLKLGGATVAGAAAFGTAQGADVKVKSAGTSPGIGGNQVYSVCHLTKIIKIHKKSFKEYDFMLFQDFR